MNKQEIYNNLINLLTSRKWKRNKPESNRIHNIFIPPAKLNFSDTYKLYILKDANHTDFEKYIGIIADIYNEDIDELASIVIEDRQILSLHIQNTNIKDAKPSIPFFNNLLLGSKELLQEAAKFSVINKPHYFDNKIEEAERYLNLCDFLKNEKGSLITKIRLPNKEAIKKANFFEPAITGCQINNNLINVVSFINDKIINAEKFQPTDEFLLNNKKLISVNITDKLKNLYKSIELADINITLKGVKTARTSYANKLNPAKIDNLKNFSKIVREKMKEIAASIVYGKIIQLKSKDVEANSNAVIIEGLINEVKSQIHLSLNSSDYKHAVEAHKTNKTVLIDGIFKKEKYNYKVTELKKFTASISTQKSLLSDRQPLE
jgi:hypothetical protein